MTVDGYGEESSSRSGGMSMLWLMLGIIACFALLGGFIGLMRMKNGSVYEYQFQAEAMRAREMAMKAQREAEQMRRMALIEQQKSAAASARAEALEAGSTARDPETTDSQSVEEELAELRTQLKKAEEKIKELERQLEAAKNNKPE